MAKAKLHFLFYKRAKARSYWYYNLIETYFLLLVPDNFFVIILIAFFKTLSRFRTLTRLISIQLIFLAIASIAPYVLFYIPTCAPT